jgi:ribosome hibernation promoting factor
VPLDVIVKAKCDVPALVRQEARRRAEHAARLIPRLGTVEVMFGQEANPRIAEPACVEVRAVVMGRRIRAQGWASDHRGAVDVAMGRFERQLVRHKARTVGRRRARARAVQAPVPIAPPADNGSRRDPTPVPRIVRRTRVAPAAMLPEEAAAQLELLGHDVVVFTNRATGGYNVVYRRREGGLGLLEPADTSD